MSNIFTDVNKTLNQLIFAVNLHIKPDPINEDEIKELFRKLRAFHSREFGKSDYIYDRNTNSATILAGLNHRQIILSPATLQYIERKNFNNHTFNSIARLLYEFYIEQKHVNFQDIKLIGKVSVQTYKIGQEGIELLKKNTGLFQNEEVTTFNVRATLVEQDKNIHFYINSLQENDEETSSHTDKNSVVIKLDINNHDQVNGINESSFGEIITFADIYAKDRLAPLLNKYFN